MGRVPLETNWKRVKILEGQAGENPDMNEQIAEFWRDHLPKQMQFALQCVLRARTLAPMVGEAVLAIRKDLNLPSYVPEFSRLLADTADGQIDHLRTGFARLLSDLNMPQSRTGLPETITR